MKRYELTNEVRTVDGHILHRVWYRDNDNRPGGFIETEKNLEEDSSATVYDTACVYGNAYVSGNAQVSDKAKVFENAEVYNDAHISGSAWVFGNAQVSGSAWVYGDARVYGDAWVCGNTCVYSHTQISGSAQVSGDTQVYGDARVCGNARISDRAWVCGDARISGNARISGDALIIGGCWERSPLQIHGTRFFFNISSPKHITIGCKTRTIQEWVNTYQDAFIASKFTKEEQAEYIAYFNLALEFYGFGIKLPVSDKEIERIVL